MQTAVEWLVSELNHCKKDSGYIEIIPDLLNKLFEQAKAMEKEQIKQAYADCSTDIGIMFSEQYYNETYKNNQ